MARRLTDRTTTRTASRWPRDDASSIDPDQLDVQLDLGLRVEREASAASAARVDASTREARGTGRTRSALAGLLALATLPILALPRAAAASTAGAAMPWDTPLQNLLSNLTGPTTRALVLIAIVACGLLWAFTRNEEGLKKLGQIAFGGAIALGAVTLVTSLGFSGAML
jgi:type IV secretion system protein VirB2